MSQSHLVYDAPAENSTKTPTTTGLGSYVTPSAESKPEVPQPRGSLGPHQEDQAATWEESLGFHESGSRFYFYCGG